MEAETSRKRAGTGLLPARPEAELRAPERCGAWNLGSDPSCHIELGFLICKRYFIILSLWVTERGWAKVGELTSPVNTGCSDASGPCQATVCVWTVSPLAPKPQALLSQWGCPICISSPPGRLREGRDLPALFTAVSLALSPASAE